MTLKVISMFQVIAMSSAVWLEQNDTCFWLSENQETFFVAEKTCVDMGSQLLSAEVDAEHIILSFSPTLEYWVNLQFDGSDFYWNNGVRVADNQWIPGNPDQDGSCARYKWSTSMSGHGLADRGCGTIHNFVCVKHHSRKLREKTTSYRRLNASQWDYLCLLTRNIAGNDADCAALCTQDYWCGYFHYNSTSLICELLTLDSSSCETTSFIENYFYEMSRDGCL